MTTTLITGVQGQDGTLLARLLRRRGHVVVGTASATAAPPSHLLEGVRLERLDICATSDFRALLEKHRPNTVVNLAARSSVAASWQDPDLTTEVNGTAVRRMLEVLADQPSPPRFLQASSSEVFGPPREAGQPTTEETPLNPSSPYAESKVIADEGVRQARTDGLATASLFLFGHTSPLQPDTFVLPTVARQAAEVGLGRRHTVQLRDPSIARDWGAAVDTVRALADSLDHAPTDLVIGTGTLTTLADASAWALEAAGASGRTESAGSPDRPRDFGGRIGDSGLAHALLGWMPERGLREEIGRMVDAWSRHLTTAEPLTAEHVD